MGSTLTCQAKVAGGALSVSQKGVGKGRQTHDRYSPGLHHVAFRAETRSDVDRLYYLLVRLKAVQTVSSWSLCFRTDSRGLRGNSIGSNRFLLLVLTDCHGDDVGLRGWSGHRTGGTVSPRCRLAEQIEAHSPHSSGLTRMLSERRANASGNSALEPFPGMSVSSWGRERNHRHEARISCCHCDRCFCRWYWTRGPFCRLVTRKAVHA